MNKLFSLKGKRKLSYSGSFSCLGNCNFGFAFFKKTLAFTLAETLIVMGIIGVVAALTLPNLNSSTGDKEKVAKVKKIYSNLEDAFGRATAVYGSFDDWFVSDTTDEQKRKRLGERISEFMKVSKTCELDSNSSCFSAGKPKSGSTTYGYDINSSAYRVITADGTSVGFTYNSGTGTYGTKPSGYVIFVDIDGPQKGSFELGKDVFAFKIGIHDEGVVPYDRLSDSFTLLGCFTTRSTCTDWVIQNGNMDYLKVNGQGKCPDGVTTLGSTNTTCK